MLKEDPAQHRNLGQHGDVDAAKRARRRHADDVAPEEGRESAAENRQCQTGDDLVGAETDAQERVNGRHRRAGGKSHRGADPGVPRPDAGAGAGEGAHEHDPLDTEVQDPGALCDQLTETGEEDSGTCRYGGRQHRDDECRGEDIGHERG